MQQVMALARLCSLKVGVDINLEIRRCFCWPFYVFNKMSWKSRFICTKLKFTSFAFDSCVVINQIY